MRNRILRTGTANFEIQDGENVVVLPRPDSDSEFGAQPNDAKKRKANPKCKIIPSSTLGGC